MIVAFSLVVPLFLIIGLGYTAVRTGLMTDAYITALDRFVFTFAMPALLFRSLAITEIPAELPWGLWLGYYCAMLGLWAIGFILARIVLKRTLRDAIIIGFGAGQGNTVMLGIPIILTGFGEEAGVPLFLLLVFHGLILITLATFLLEATAPNAQADEGPSSSFWRTAWEGLKSSARNPVLIGLAFGAVYGQLGLAIPGPVDRALEMLGGAAIPAALFVVGGVLTRYQVRHSIAAASMTSLLKLIGMPAAVYCLSAYVFALPPLWVAVSTVLAGMPTGVYSSILANRFQVAPDAASSTVVLGTGLSIITLSTLVAIFLQTLPG